MHAGNQDHASGLETDKHAWFTRSALFHVFLLYYWCTASIESRGEHCKAGVRIRDYIGACHGGVRAGHG